MHIQIMGMMVEVGLGEGMAEQIQALPFAKVIEYKRGKAFLCVWRTAAKMLQVDCDDSKR